MIRIPVIAQLSESVTIYSDRAEHQPVGYYRISQQHLTSCLLALDSTSCRTSKKASLLLKMWNETVALPLEVEHLRRSALGDQHRQVPGTQQLANYKKGTIPLQLLLWFPVRTEPRVLHHPLFVHHFSSTSRLLPTGGWAIPSSGLSYHSLRSRTRQNEDDGAGCTPICVCFKPGVLSGTACRAAPF